MPERHSTPIGPLATVGVALLIAGLIGWLWLGDWRWAVTGVLLMLLGVVVSGTRNQSCLKSDRPSNREGKL